MATKAQGAGLSVDITPSAKAGEAVTMLARAQTLRVVDKATHVLCLENLKGAKALKREIEAHYDAIKKPLNTARNTVLQMERDHLAPIEQAITVLERTATSYLREQERIEREAAETARRKAEDAERKRREAEQAEAERRAEALEAASENLSAREQRFVQLLVAMKDRTIKAVVMAAKLAGYKDPEASGRRLIGSQKVNDAIEAADKAAAIRREAEAKKAAPMVVETTPVESQIGKVAGTSNRTYYGCGDVDLRALILAAAENIKTGDGTMVLALQPDTVYLNEQARSLKEMFPRVWPMCTLAKREGVAG